MSVILIRSLILYVLVIFAVRLMGKRQLGELQPSELVITILVSNIATLPLEDAGIPLIVGVTPILSLVCGEVIMSWLCMLFPKLRKAVSGSPKIIISNGTIEPSVLRELRLSPDDLLTAMRGAEVFDLSEVQFAIVETTGSISVMKKPQEGKPADPPLTIAVGGELLQPALESLRLSRAAAEAVISRAGLRLSDVFLMTADSFGNYYIADCAGSPPHIIRGGKNDDKG